MLKIFAGLLMQHKPTPPAIPRGYVLVPITPTLAMIRAGHDHTREGVVGVWKAMIEQCCKHGGEHHD